MTPYNLRAPNGQFRKKDSPESEDTTADAAYKAYKRYAKAVDENAKAVDEKVSSTPAYDVVDFYLKDAAAKQVKMKREVYSLDEGDVTISCPAKLSLRSENELQDIFTLFLKRVCRQ
jgi:hypothetical protein